MRKIISNNKIVTFALIFAITVTILGKSDLLTWSKVAGAAGSTTLATPSNATDKVSIKRLMIGGVQNACNMYLHYGTKVNVAASPLTYIISPHYYMGAVSIYSSNYPINFYNFPLDWEAAAGEAVYIWFDTDPGVESILYKYELINDN